LKALLVIGLIVVALVAIGFAVAPVWRATALKDRYLLIGAIAVALLGVGGGTYWMLGQPYLAWRSAQGVNTRDINGLIGLLIKRVRQAPDDMQAWVYLGRAYMGAGDAGDAAKAYARAVALANRAGRPDAALDSMYGEALVAANSGQVSDAAAEAFRAAMKLNPKEPASRFFLGDSLGAWRQGRRDGFVEWTSGRSAGQFAAASGAGGPHCHAHRAIRGRARSQGDGGDAGGSVEARSQRCGRLAAPDPRLCRAGRTGRGPRRAGHRAQKFRRQT